MPRPSTAPERRRPLSQPPPPHATPTPTTLPATSSREESSASPGTTLPIPSPSSSSSSPTSPSPSCRPPNLSSDQPQQRPSRPNRAAPLIGEARFAPRGDPRRETSPPHKETAPPRKETAPPRKETAPPRPSTQSEHTPRDAATSITYTRTYTRPHRTPRQAAEAAERWEGASPNHPPVAADGPSEARRPLQKGSGVGRGAASPAPRARPASSCGDLGPPLTRGGSGGTESKSDDPSEAAGLLMWLEGLGVRVNREVPLEVACASGVVLYRALQVGVGGRGLLLMRFSLPPVQVGGWQGSTSHVVCTASPAGCG